jgi:hypothetical protein
MRLDLLKWVYKLGQRHERARIARYLMEERDRALDGSPEFVTAVRRRMRQIINEILEPSSEKISSIMYPEESEK